MEFKSMLIVVTDMERSKRFYREALGLEVEMDLGANVALTGGLALQTLESWSGFIETGAGDIAFGGRDAEAYFEEDDMDGFAQKLKAIDGVKYVHGFKEHEWGQKAVRFFDPDGHIIEVGESMGAVCARLLRSGMSVEAVASKTMMPLDVVKYISENPKS